MRDRALRRWAAAAAVAVFGLSACADEPEERVYSDPYAGSVSECLERAEDEDFNAGIRNGDVGAIRCTLVIGQGLRSDPELDELPLFYFLYRIEGVEPEGFDAIVRRQDRAKFAAFLQNRHEFETFLEPFGTHWWTHCPVYDPVAKELLERTRPSEDMHCLPRGQR